MIQNAYVAEMLVRAFIILLFFGSVFCLAIGASLMFRTGSALRFIGAMNRWVSTEPLRRALETPLNTGSLHAGARMRRLVVGAVLVIGGAYAAFILVSRVDMSAMLWLFGVRPAHAHAAVVLFDALRAFLVLGCVAAIVVGVLLSMLPKAWTAIETRLNLWYSTRQLEARGDIMYVTLDRWVQLSPRKAGVVIAALSAIPAFAAGLLLFSRLG